MQSVPANLLSFWVTLLQAIQPGALVISNGIDAQAMQMTASPKLSTSQGSQAAANLNPQAAQEAHALANASETLKAQAQTLKVCHHDLSVNGCSLCKANFQTLLARCHASCVIASGNVKALAEILEV